MSCDAFITGNSKVGYGVGLNLFFNCFKETRRKIRKLVDIKCRNDTIIQPHCSNLILMLPCYFIYTDFCYISLVISLLPSGEPSNHFLLAFFETTNPFGITRLLEIKSTSYKKGEPNSSNLLLWEEVSRSLWLGLINR